MEQHPPSSPAPSTVGRSRRRVRREHAALAGAAVVIVLLAVLLFVVEWNVESLRRYGYAGLFLVNLIGAAGMVIPVPGLASVFGGGGLLDPVLGVPAPVVVGAVAGLGEAIGEITGYMAGYGSRAAFAERRLYRRLERWMSVRGMVTMFTVAAIPNPLFDVAGALAGAAQMPLWRFFVSVLAGKCLKATYVAAAGALGLGVLERVVA